MYINHDPEIDAAIDKLGRDFPNLKWDFSPDPSTGKNEPVSHWLGEESEEVMVNVFKGKKIDEQFHRQDFFYFHFAYRGDYVTLSEKYGSHTTIHEGECYIGQPYSGYAAKYDSDRECIIIGILIRIETFIREYLSALSADTTMLNFFLEPQKNKFSDEFIHLEIPDTSPVWKLLGIIAYEYANKTENTQKIIKPMVLSLAMYLASEYRRRNLHENIGMTDQVQEYIEMYSDTATLASTAAHFGYHPVYLSRLISKKTGKKFSELILESRMRKAKKLIELTDLSIEVIANMIGYSNTSNFYKAFRMYFGTSPRNLN